ncbi:Cyclic nucleotide-binding domain-containing protein [Paenibacillus sp. UNCCL117]|uniref:cyclic nucleotide-binding domain-containing protein n=1 Tax=unclassified Paenibacillus TaxID=185978 RepID=UPI0008846299|nr:MULTISPECIES: cyclic nucleotide-binding domain-containing protein [unclassified Paenibacillus]SDC92012.1 Cyclic nucleotide-binding domain-containing protein [Paenibacillus sp. cl123]SFW29220.1 Cyclic nucleotide-binding domain-containing protein [Paenibacillus sp. UNCCL117]
MDNFVEILKGHTLLHGVPDLELASAAATMEWMRYADGELLIREGAVGDDCFFLISGEVKVTARSLVGSQVQLAALGPGALIGEIALLSSERRTATVQASGEVLALRLDREAFRKLSASSPMFHESLTYSARIRTIHGLLSKASIWSSIPDSELRGLAEITILVQAAKGELIVHEGAQADCFYTVGSGSFEVCSGGKRIAVLRQGDYVGEIALLTGSSHTATVRALEDGLLLSIGKEEFGFILMQYGPVKRQFLTALGLRRPELAEAAERLWGKAEQEDEPASPARSRSLSERLQPNRQLWVDVLLAAGGLFLLATVLAIWLEGAFWVYAALAAGALAGPVTFVAYARSSQLLGFRLTRLIGAFAASAAVAVPLAFFLERRWLFGEGEAYDPQLFAQLHVPLTVALIEEASKLLICWLFLRGRTHRFKMDAIVFGAAAGMGFAAVESLVYGWTFWEAGAAGSMLAVLWLRALLSPFGHGTWTAIAAVGLWFGSRRGIMNGQAAVSRAAGLWNMAGLLLASVLLHALWDYHFASGLLRLAGMAAAGGAGIALLLRLIRSGSAEELRVLTSLNPALGSAAAPPEEGDEQSGRLLSCESCGTQCPRDTRYCPRCGQALRLPEAAKS